MAQSPVRLKAPDVADTPEVNVPAFVHKGPSSIPSMLLLLHIAFERLPWRSISDAPWKPLAILLILQSGTRSGQTSVRYLIEDS